MRGVVAESRHYSGRLGQLSPRRRVFFPAPVRDKATSTSKTNGMVPQGGIKSFTQTGTADQRHGGSLTAVCACVCSKNNGAPEFPLYKPEKTTRLYIGFVQASDSGSYKRMILLSVFLISGLHIVNAS